MALFRRKNNPTISEIESYYEQQNRRSTSTGRAWVMAILAILLTVLVLAILFFGGRWLYNTIVDNDSTDTTQQDVNSGQVDIDGFDGEITGPGSDRDIASTDSDQDSEGQVSEEAASTNESNVDRIAGSNTDENNDEETSSSVAGSATNIPNTGAGETALFISVIAGIIATTATYRRQLVEKQ